MIGSATRASAALAVLLVAMGCGGGTAVSPTSAGVSPAERAKPAASAEPAAPITFIEDDYPRALAEARSSGRPLFVDAWAPWCHSCLSMRAYVLTDPSLAPLANELVWLAIDTEKDANAPFVERFTNRVWPTLWIIDAAREAPLLRWEGTATAPELLTLLATARASSGPHATEAAVAFVKANQAAARGDVAEAERGYRAAMSQKDFPERARALEALVGLLATRKDLAACAELAASAGPSMPPGTSRATVLATGLSCAREGKRAAELRALVASAERAAADPDPRTMADDRSALFEELVESKTELGDAAGARATARAWAAYLEREAARAPSKEARAVFDAHRLSAYLAAGEPERAVPILAASERDFPDDYNPPARLALAYLTSRQLEQAKAAISRATARVYGPRSLRVFALAADIARARNDRAGERAALQEGLARTSRAVLNENQKKLRSELEKRLSHLGSDAATPH